MDVVGSEIGQKMRSAIKAKLTELGCYVDDELPDYVMVMVANKRTRAQMEDDLQLFLGDNTELFVNWLHQVLKKLQEVTVPTPKAEPEKPKEKVKEKKAKDKKDKDKSKSKKIDSLKKAKKKEKHKEKLRKKEEKKSKSKKKSKHHEMIHPNVPPLLMNMEKVSEPSITDVFAGQILKNHGIIVEEPKQEKPDQKPVIIEPKRPILPVIDPATINQPETVEPIVDDTNSTTSQPPREEQIQEIDEIEAKIQGLKQKLAEQLDSMSDDEDFLNIRTEAEELMNDFAEDVFQEISSQAPAVSTPPISKPIPPSVPPKPLTTVPPQIDLPLENPRPIIEPPKTPDLQVLPQIELKLPKRPVRERLGARDQKKVEETPSKEKEESSKVEKEIESPERLTPEKEPDFWGKYKSSAKSRLGDPPEGRRKSPITVRKTSFLEDTEAADKDMEKERNASGGGVGRAPPPSPPPRVRASVVCVRPRPRPRAAPATSLLMRAVADAHKSLLNIPPKPEVDPQKVKRALVHPMRRCVDGQNIVIQVPADDDRQGDYEEKRHKLDSRDIIREEYVPAPITKKITNTDYVPSRRLDRSSNRKDETLIIETINIHDTTVGKDKNTQFIVTMDGFNPNAFLAKKLQTEGLLDDEDSTIEKKPKLKNVSKVKSVLKTADTKTDLDNDKIITEDKEINQTEDKIKDIEKIIEDREKIRNKDKDLEEQVKKAEEEKQVEVKENITEESPQKKRLSDTSDDSDTQVILNQDNVQKDNTETLVSPLEEVPQKTIETPPAKKRKASPIVFHMNKEKENEERKRQRTESASSDNHVIVTTAAADSHKYDAVPPRFQDIPQQKPPISTAEKKTVWCRSFPLCRYGAACAFLHPRCKFAAACTRRGCPYSHAGVAPTAVPTSPTVASHVVPAANYKSISGTLPSVCKYYPNCVNPSCHFYHPKPCRYGKACANRLECNFYHQDATKWRYPV